MDLSLQYEVNVESSDHYFDVNIKIPKKEADSSGKSSHEINMIFNQIIIFSEAMEMNQNWNSQDIRKSLEKIISDLRSFSNEICWVKAIHKGIKKINQ